MRETLREEVTVSLVFDRKTKRVIPRRILWQGNTYTTSKVGLHHTFKRGDTLIHVFSVVTDKDLFFRLEFDTKTLHWTLTEVSDGLPN